VTRIKPDMRLKSEIRQFVVDNFLYGRDDHTLGDDVSFLEKGIIDSTGVLELVSFIEEKYNVSVDDEELIPDNFDTLNNISSYVVKKMGNSH
jgi:acyl carrier protein